MPNETYICTLYLPKKKRAIAYQLEKSDPLSTEKSVIKIFRAEEEKSLHEIQHAGKVKSMHWVKQDLFAVTMEGCGNILLYNYQQGKLENTLFIPQSILPQYSTFTLSSFYLISSTYEGMQRTEVSYPLYRTITHLHVYDTEIFSYKRIIVEGVIVNTTALTTFNHLLFCEVSNRMMGSSHVYAYNLQKGTVLGRIGENKMLPGTRPFLALLNNEYLFRTHMSGEVAEAPNCSLYRLHPSLRTETFEIRYSPGFFFCALPQGGIAAVPCPIEKKAFISIYHLLESKIPEIVTSELPVELKTSEDVTSFLAKKELPRLMTEVVCIGNALCKLSLFPEPVDKLVTAYSLSSEAQEDRFIDEIVESSWPKPQ